MTTHRTLRTADIIASQLQRHNGGLLEEVTGAELMAEPDMWAGFAVTGNDGMRYRVLVTPAAESGLTQIPPETPQSGKSAGFFGGDVAGEWWPGGTDR